MLTILKVYCQESSIHGLRYLFHRNCHWTEKVFWLVCISLSVWGTAYCILSSFHNFRFNSMNFVEETDYLWWNTTFPSVTLCEKMDANSEKYLPVMRKLHPEADEDLLYDYLTLYMDIAFFKDSCLSCDQDDFEGQWPTPDKFYDLAIYIRKNCSEMMETCAWNAREFDCCRHFRRIDTEMGPCFSLNSLQSIEETPASEMLTSNRLTGPGKLYIKLKAMSWVYTTAADYVPSWNEERSEYLMLQPNEHVERLIAIKEIYNDPRVREMNTEQRQCRFPDEKFGSMRYRYYSYSACQIDCRTRIMMKLCNCTHHFLFSTANICTKDGMRCVVNSRIQGLLKALRVSHAESFDCGCISSCTNPDYTEVYSHATKTESKFPELTLSMSALPSQRLKRTVVFGRLDLVVSIGGIAGLFLGASILSAVEVIYYFLVRPCKK